MNKILLSITASTFIVNMAQAEEKLEDIMVVTTATKTEKNIEGVAASVVLIDEKKIEEMGATGLGDIINKTPGIIRQYGTFPSASSKSKSSISLRGMGATNTLFLIDGKRLSGEVSNPYDLDRIPASIIERVEIVKGAMSSLYGADAVGGVINIITKKPTEKLEGSIGLKYGANSDGDGSNTDVNFNVRGSSGKLRYSIYGSQMLSEPYTENEEASILLKTDTGKIAPSQHPHPGTAAMQDNYNTDVTYREEADVFNVGTRLEYDLSDTVIAGLDLSYMEEEREGVYNSIYHPSGLKSATGASIPAFNAPVNSKDENRRRNIGADIKWLASDDLSLDFKVYNSYYEKRNTTTMKHYQDFGFADEASSASNGMNADVDISSYEIMANYALNDAHLLTMGAEHRDEKRDATVFTSSSDMSRENVDYQAVYLQDEWEVSDTLNFILGGRYDAISNADNKPTFRIGAVKNLDGGINLRANFAQAYRTPDIREMYINKQTPAGLMTGANHLGYDLKPEFTNSYEIAMGGKKDGFDYDVALFLNEIDDRIEQVAGATENSYTFQNVSEAETKGVEAHVGYKSKSGIYTGLTFNEMRTENKDTGKSLEFTPNRTLSANIDMPINENFKLGALATYVGEQAYSLTQTDGSNVDKTTEKYTLLDLTASYSFGDKSQYNIHGGVNNLLNEEVETILGSNVGTYSYLGASMNF